MPKSTVTGYRERMRQFANEFFEQNGGKPARRGEIAAWIIRHREWEPPKNILHRMCAEDIAKAMREEYVTNDNGQPVRVKHAFPVICDGKQRMFWGDVRKLPREQSVAGLQQRRQQIVSECCQLKRDEDFVNDLHPDAEPHQTIFDFTEDVAEAMYVAEAA